MSSVQRAFAWFALFVSSAHAYAHVGSTSPMSGGQGWELIARYSDEFFGDELDREKWTTDVKPWGQWTWDNTNVKVEHGLLQITMKYLEHARGNETLYYRSGIIKSTGAPLLYGYIEARVRAGTRDQGVSPAVWLQRTQPTLLTEIDVVELTQLRGQPHDVQFNTHVFRAPGLPAGRELHEQRHWIAPWHPSQDFHVYGCEWTPSEIFWYVDGTLRARRKNVYWHQPLDILISMGLRQPLINKASPDGFPTTMTVDYIRIWQKQK